MNLRLRSRRRPKPIPRMIQKSLRLLLLPILWLPILWLPILRLPILRLLSPSQLSPISLIRHLSLLRKLLRLVHKLQPRFNQGLQCLHPRRLRLQHLHPLLQPLHLLLPRLWRKLRLSHRQLLHKLQRPAPPPQHLLDRPRLRLRPHRHLPRLRPKHLHPLPLHLSLLLQWLLLQ